jgi:hypothetical protein
MQRREIGEWLRADERFIREIGLLDRDGDLYTAREDKFDQIVGLVEQAVIVTRPFARARPVTILDLACGRSYASFAIYHVLRNLVGRAVRVVGVDTNAELVERCRQTAEARGMDMEFHAARCGDFTMAGRPDCAISLHACDTATDEALAASVRLSARTILAVPCCHRYVQPEWSGHPLAGLTQFAVCRDRLVTMLTDTMRALLLREVGYEVELLEFVPTSITPKNLMLRAQWRNQPSERAREQYEALAELIDGRPALEGLLADGAVPPKAPTPASRPSRPEG